MWYVLQVSVFVYVSYFFIADVKPGEPVGFIFLYAAGVSYIVTLIAVRILDGLRKVTKLVTGKIRPDRRAKLTGGPSKPPSLLVR